MSLNSHRARTDREGTEGAGGGREMMGGEESGREMGGTSILETRLEALREALGRRLLAAQRVRGIRSTACLCKDAGCGGRVIRWTCGPFLLWQLVLHELDTAREMLLLRRLLIEFQWSLNKAFMQT
jgi:hypothetical protein